MTPEQQAAQEAAAATAATAAADKEKKIEFTPEQQEYFNTTVKARLARQQKELEKTFTERYTTLETQINDLKSQVKPEGDKGGDGDPATKDMTEAQRKQHKELLEAEQRKAAAEAKKREEAEKQLTEAKKAIAERDKLDAIRKAMSGKGFHSPEEVIKLTGDQVELSADGKNYVVKENGILVENSSLEPMTLDEFYAHVAATKTWLVSSDLVSGTGATPAGKSPTVTSKADLKNAQEKSEYIERHGMEAFLKLK